MLYGYIRISGSKQDIEGQRRYVQEFARKRFGDGVQMEYIEEVVSTRVKMEKRKISELLTTAQKGDAIIISEISRLARSTLEVLTIAEMAAEKEIEIYIVKEGIEVEYQSIAGRAVLVAFGLASDIERAMISSRTKYGLELARERLAKEGRNLGRPKGKKSTQYKLDKHLKDIKKYLEMGLSKKKIADMFGVTTATLYRFMKNRNLEEYIKN